MCIAVSFWCSITFPKSSVFGVFHLYCYKSVIAKSYCNSLLICTAGLDEFIAEASSDLPSRQFHQPPPPPHPPASTPQQQETGISFGGYTNLFGEILTIPVTKVNKKLGMAIDGGANTKQVAITIRQITVCPLNWLVGSYSQGLMLFSGEKLSHFCVISVHNCW